MLVFVTLADFYTGEYFGSAHQNTETSQEAALATIGADNCTAAHPGSNVSPRCQPKRTPDCCHWPVAHDRGGFGDFFVAPKWKYQVVEVPRLFPEPLRTLLGKRPRRLPGAAATSGLD